MPAQSHPQNPCAPARDTSADHAGGSARDAWPGDHMQRRADDFRSGRPERYQRQTEGAASMSHPRRDEGRRSPGISG